MAQKILLRRGGLANLNSGATIAVTQGEQLFASGALSNTNIENVTFVANASGNGTFQAVGRLFTGTAAADSFDAKLNGLPYYRTDEEALYRLGESTALDLSGNLEGTTVAAMTITNLSSAGLNISGDITGSNLLITNNTDLRGTLDLVGDASFGSDLSVTGDISGSNLYLSGNADIDGNITLGGNITIGDANTDNISLGGEITSDIIPDADNTYALGSSTRRWNVYGVDSSITGSFSGSFSGDGSGLTGLVTELNITDGVNNDAVDLLTDTLTFTNASTHGFTFSVTDNTVTLNTPQDLRTTAEPTFAGATLGDITVGVSTDTTITTTGGNLTLDSTGGTVVVNDNLTVTGDLTVQGTRTIVDSTTVEIGDNIIELNAAGTVADGGIQVVDAIGTAGTGSLLWNATDDYWYAGMSGSTHYRISTFENQSPAQGVLPYVSGSAKRLVASPFSYDETFLSSSADLDMRGNDIIGIGTLQVTGLDPNSFTHTDASKNISTVAPSVAGDLFQWNGTAFVASNVIDGGTF